MKRSDILYRQAITYCNFMDWILSRCDGPKGTNSTDGYHIWKTIREKYKKHGTAESSINLSYYLPLVCELIK